MACNCGARSAFQTEGISLLEKHAIAPSAAGLLRLRTIELLSIVSQRVQSLLNSLPAHPFYVRTKLSHIFRERLQCGGKLNLRRIKLDAVITLAGILTIKETLIANRHNTVAFVHDAIVDLVCILPGRKVCAFQHATFFNRLKVAIQNG